jgi:hypothetical protein
MPSVDVSQAFIDAGTALVNGTDYVLIADVTMTTPFTFAGDGSGVTFDGSGHVIIVPPGAWGGLFSNAISVSNLGIRSTGGFVEASHGWFFAAFVGGSATNCYSTGAISAGGGIFGGGSSGTATNCFSTGAIGDSVGGIFGGGSSGTAINCYSTGTIAYYGGGIFGWMCTGSATNCYSTGYHIGEVGGIFGYLSPNGTATNCYVTGGVGKFGDGMFAQDSPTPVGTSINCNSSNGWIDTIANNTLTGLNTIWVSPASNTPYTLLANPLPAINVSLATVVVNGSTLIADSGSYSYTFDISASSTLLYITTQDTNATVSVDTLTGTHDLSGSLSLVAGSNPFTITVTGIDATTIATYPLTINTPSSNNLLSSLSVLVNTTSVTVTDYSCTLPFFFESIQVSLTTENATSTVQVGTLSGTHDLSGTLNITRTGVVSFPITVTAQNGDVAIYTLEVTVPPYQLTDTSVINGFILKNNYSYILAENVSMNSPFSFDGDGSGITVDGNGFTITAVGTSWPGLFSKAVTVQNLGVLSAGTTALQAGWFFANGVAGSATNCYSTGAIGPAGGGIFGATSSGTAANCYSLGTIGEGAGGIFGGGSNGSVTNCYSLGLLADGAGGIYGDSSTGNGTNVYVVNGGRWSDASANAVLTGVPDSTTPVWCSVAANTPYLLVANLQTSSDVDLTSVVVNDVDLTADADAYTYSLPSIAASTSVVITTKEAHASVEITDSTGTPVLAGHHIVSGSLTLSVGSNSFTVVVTALNSTTVKSYPLTIQMLLPTVYINQAFIAAGTALQNDTSYILAADVSMNSPFTFDGSGTGITFDGSGHTVTAVSTSWPGLFSQAVTVQNLGVLSTGTMAIQAGWFFASGVGGSATNCYSTGGMRYRSGGIFGDNSSGSATNCYSNGTIGQDGGGIIGADSTGSATNCYSTGSASDEFGGGGICGAYSTGSVLNCYSTGTIGQSGGGIFGSNSTGSATNCYSTGAIVNRGGGIFGEASYGPAINCYSTGTIGTDAGGIFGYSSIESITNCYVVNGGLWIDADANAPTALTDLSGSTMGTAVWFRYNDVPDTPYLLVANPQSPSDDDDLLTVVVNGSTRTASNNAYAYTFDSSAATIPIFIITEQPHALVRIENQDLSGGGDLSGNLPLVPGVNNFTIIVTAQTGAPTTHYPLTINTPSNDDDLSLVSIDGTTVDISGGRYSYTLRPNVSSVPVRVTTNESNAIASIVVSDLSGSNDLSGSLTVSEGMNLFMIHVVAHSGANATYPLVIQVSPSTVYINQAFITAGTALQNDTSYILTANVSMNSPFTFSGSGAGVTFDGSGHTITAPGNWAGLFNVAVTVRNLGILSGGLTVPKVGWFFTTGVGGSATNCYSTGTIGLYGGGIFGSFSNGSATNCYSTGASGQFGGGIFGYVSNGSATNCYSTGTIGLYGGGIFGSNSPGSATNCYSTGTIGLYGGGIFGYRQRGSVTNCYALNGGLWFDTDANANLTGVPGSGGSAVWSRYNNVPNTPYLLVANPQPPSSDVRLSSVIVANNVSLTAPYAYTLPSSTPLMFISLVTIQPHALVSIQDLSGGGDLKGKLTIVPGVNNFTISVTAQTGATTSYSLVITAPPSAPVSPPSTPTRFKVTVSSEDTATLTWSSPSGVITDYKVYQSTVESGPYTLLTTTSPLTTSSTVTLSTYNNYYFKVSATNAGGQSPLSASKQAQKQRVPSAPTHVVAVSAATAGSATLTFTPPSYTGMTEIVSYNVYQNGTRLPESFTPTQPITLTELENGTPYTFQISAVNNSGEGIKSGTSKEIVLTAYTSTLSTFLSGGSTTSFTAAITATAATSPSDAILNTRLAIQNANATGSLTPEQRQTLTVAALQALNTTGNTVANVNSNTASLRATMASVSQITKIDTTLPTVNAIPSYTTGPSPHTATLDLASTLMLDDITVSYADVIRYKLGYIVFELPNSVAGSVYELTLTYQGASLALTYNGTVLIDHPDLAEYNADTPIQVGSLTIPLIGLGSVGTGGSSLYQVTVDSSSLLTDPYAYTVESNKASVPVHLTSLVVGETIRVLNAASAVLLTGTSDLTGSLPLVTGTNTFTIQVGTGETITSESLTITNPAPGPVPCFPAGTRIRTASGYKTVETLVQGELVLTADGRQVPVKIYGKHLPTTTSVTAPYRVPKGTFGLANDLLLSPDHAFQIRKGVWMLPKRAALLSDRVEQVGVGSPVTYYHLECPAYLRDNLVVDGTIVESYGGKAKSPYTYSESLKGYTRATGPIVKRA